jgi:hypothetical protein
VTASCSSGHPQAAAVSAAGHQPSGRHRQVTAALDAGWTPPQGPDTGHCRSRPDSRTRDTARAATDSRPPQTAAADPATGPHIAAVVSGGSPEAARWARVRWSTCSGGRGPGGHARPTCGHRVALLDPWSGTARMDTHGCGRVPRTPRRPSGVPARTAMSARVAPCGSRGGAALPPASARAAPNCPARAVLAIPLPTPSASAELLGPPLASRAVEHHAGR